MVIRSGAIARFANGITGFEALMPEDMTSAPEMVVPEEFRVDGVPATAPPPQGLAGRLKQAIRAGKKASREAQAEQQRRFEESTNR